MKLDPAPVEGEGTREKRNQMADVSHATETKGEMYLRKPGGRRNRKKGLQQRVVGFREPCTLVEVLTWLKEIIRDNLLFDERNPSMIVGDAPLEVALRNKRVQ